jgi:hypothetical protein
MTKFIYWNNSKEWHEEILAEITADSITEADKLFEEQTGINPNKPTIACQPINIPKE